MTRERYDCDLIVDDAQAVYEYLYSYPGNVKDILDRRGGELLDLIHQRIEQEGALFITKSQGMFICQA